MEHLMANDQKLDKPLTAECECGATIHRIDTQFFQILSEICPACCEKARQKVLARQQRECEYEKQERIEAVIPERSRDAKLSDLAPQLKAALLSLDYGQGVYLWGGVGVGKTWAMSALIRENIESDIWVKRVVWSELLYEIKKTYGGLGQESDVLHNVVTAKKLFIEDLGSTARLEGQDSEFACRTLDFIIDKRHEACLPTYITSNASIENLGLMYTERTTSRIQEGCLVIKLDGKDRRKKK